MHESSILNDTTFWYGVAVFIFVAAIVWKARGGIAGILDAEIQKVRNDLDEARRLREEAQATLAEYRKKQAEAMKEAEEIVAAAKVDADRLRHEAQAELEASLARAEQLALDRIKLVQDEAMAEVRTYIIDEAMGQVRGKMGKLNGTPEAGRLIDAVISDIPRLSNGKVA